MLLTCSVKKSEKDFSINVISKSGATIEPAITFRVFQKFLVNLTTDKARGALKTLSDAEGYECFIFPNVVGGRLQF